MAGRSQFTAVSKRPADDRFWEKVVKGPGCWLWAGAKDRDGYGNFYAGQENGQMVWIRAHVWAWQDTYGLVPDGLVLDHEVCDNTSCVRPDHLQPKSQGDNVRRSRGNPSKTHCPKGHAYDFVDGQGRRRCRECKREKDRRLYWRKRGSA